MRGFTLLQSTPLLSSSRFHSLDHRLMVGSRSLSLQGFTPFSNPSITILISGSFLCNSAKEASERWGRSGRPCLSSCWNSFGRASSWWVRDSTKVREEWKGLVFSDDLTNWCFSHITVIVSAMRTDDSAPGPMRWCSVNCLILSLSFCETRSSRDLPCGFLESGSTSWLLWGWSNPHPSVSYYCFSGVGDVLL